MLSIGPYHQGKENLQEVETYKLRYLYELLHRRGDSSAERYIIALTQLEDRARRCYAEKISHSKDDFVKMLCLDGCFIIQFLRKLRYPGFRNWDDPIFQMVTGPNRKVVPGIKLIKSARELQECGIKFEKYKDSKSRLDIAFDNGAIKIPPLSVEDHTETVFRNLIALEEYYTSRSPKPSETRRCVVDYVTFMDLLIDCSKYVEKLRHGQIIDKWIGSDEAVCILFNKLGIYVTIVPSKFSYNEVFKKVNDYSWKPWNIWVANLMTILTAPGP